VAGDFGKALFGLAQFGFQQLEFGLAGRDILFSVQVSSVYGYIV
jgi:hypothetical protein